MIVDVRDHGSRPIPAETLNGYIDTNPFMLLRQDPVLHDYCPNGTLPSTLWASARQLGRSDAGDHFLHSQRPQSV